MQPVPFDQRRTAQPMVALVTERPSCVSGVTGRFAVTVMLGVFLTGCASRPLSEETMLQRPSGLNVTMGIGYMEQGRYDVAMEKLEKAIREDPALPEAYVAMARLYRLLNKPDVADEYFARALRLAGSRPDILTDYGIYLCQAGQWEQAEASFARAIADASFARPEYAHTAAGRCALRARNNQRAKEHFAAALAISPFYQPALRDLAHLSYETGNYSVAQGMVERYMRAVPSPDADMLYLAVLVYRALGRFEQAQHYRGELLRLFPGSAQAARLQGPR